MGLPKPKPCQLHAVAGFLKKDAYPNVQVLFKNNSHHRLILEWLFIEKL